MREAAASDDEMISGPEFAPDGRQLVASQRSGRVPLWDMDRPQHCLEGYRECAARVLRLQAKPR